MNIDLPRKKMHILVTNDDGVRAPGLLALVHAMRNVGEVSVLAPDRDWSGGGHVKTLNRPLRVHEVYLEDGTPAYTSDGAPSDCVALALLGFIHRKIDLVVSGINPVANLGHDVTYSGTVTAAMEAVIWGKPGIAISLDTRQDHIGKIDFQPAAIIAEIITDYVINSGLPPGILINANVPSGLIRGIQATKQGTRVYRDRLDQRYDPRGNPYYWIGGDSPSGVSEDGTDFGALEQGYVSLTPLQSDLTHFPSINYLNQLVGDFNFPIHEFENRSNGRS
jgi:5'-nucleotidase